MSSEVQLEPWLAPLNGRPSLRTALAKCEPGQVIAAQHRGRELVIGVLRNGYAFAADDRCPHDGGLLSTGFLEGGYLVCPRHGWEFNVCSGQCPATKGAKIDVFPLPLRSRTTD